MSSTLHLNCSSSATTSSSRMQGSRCPQCPTAPRRLAVVAAAGKASSNPRTSKLRERLKQPGILQGPCCHDGLSARLIERAGFQFAFMSGFCTAGARLGAPDTGLISYAEMVDVGRNIHEATRSIPIIGDGDTGYGNAMNVKRTVRGYAQAGFAGILIEDQVAPKSCGHVKGKRVTSREEAVSRIRAAADAREEGADILIVARTDARQAASLEEALWRAEAFADAGADILFIDALESEEEMRRFCWSAGPASRLPKMANMLEGGGKTPILSPQELQDMGFKLVAYPLSLLGVSIRAMDRALAGLKQGRLPPPEDLGTFQDIQAAVGFPEYFAEEAKYAISLPGTAPSPSTLSPTPASAAPAPPKPPPADNRPPSGAPPTTAAQQGGSTPSAAAGGPAASAPSGSAAGPRQAGAAGEPAPPSVVEADVVLEDDPPGPQGALVAPAAPRASGGGGGGSSSGGALPPPGGQAGAGGFPQARYLLVKITEKATGVVKLETRIPAGFLAGLGAFPMMAGLNLESVVERALRERARNEPGGPLVSLNTGSGDLLEVFLEV